MAKFKKYAKEFAQDESGMELLQFAIVTVMSVMLIGAVLLITKAVDGGLQGSANDVVDGFGEAGIDVNLE